METLGKFFLFSDCHVLILFCFLPAVFNSFFFLQLRCALRSASCCSDLALVEFSARLVTLPKLQRAAVLHFFSGQVPSQKGTSNPAHLWDLRLQGLRKPVSPGPDRISQPVLTFQTPLHAGTAGVAIEAQQRVSHPSPESQPHPPPSHVKLHSVGHACVSCPAAL